MHVSLLEIHAEPSARVLAATSPCLAMPSASDRTMPLVDRGFPVDVTFSSCQTDPQGTAGRRERQERRRWSWSVDLRRERWSASFPRGPPSSPQWTSSSKAELPASYHQVPRKARGEEWMDSNGAEEGTWGLNGGHAGIGGTCSAGPRAGRCLLPPPGGHTSSRGKVPRVLQPWSSIISLPLPFWGSGEWCR